MGNIKSLGCLNVENFKKPNTNGYNKISKKEQTSRSNSPSPSDVNQEEFKRLKILGKGSFGKVILVKHRSTDKLYAMKVLHKNQIIKHDCIENIKTERFLLEGANHPFIINLRYAFDSEFKLFFVLDYIQGGNLENLLRSQKNKRFKEDSARFYAAELVLALQYLHKNHVLHRDLKLSNILLDRDGHIKLTDFGLSTFYTESKKLTNVCGTYEYLSFEMALNAFSTSHEIGYNECTGNGEYFNYLILDFWGLGILIYEMIFGTTPFDDETPVKIMKNIIRKEVEFPTNIKVSEDAKDIIKRLLKKNKKNRLGSKGIQEIMEHPWMKQIDFEKLYRKEVDPPLIPKLKHHLDVSYFKEKKLKHLNLNSPQEDSMTPTTEKAFNEKKKDFGTFFFDSTTLSNRTLNKVFEEEVKKEEKENINDTYAQLERDYT